MCTVSVIPLSPTGGLRVVCNRDERHARPPALPPLVRRFRDRIALMPVDPRSGGTWIAVNDAGLLMFLLNYNPRPMRFARLSCPSVSRGTLIPKLLHCATAAEAVHVARRLDTRRHDPFRLFVMAKCRLWQMTSDGSSLRFERPRLGESALVFSSSGLGDDLVRRPREALFDSMVAQSPTPGAQDAFHAHVWPERPGISVCMQRDAARTVSRTIVELHSDSAVMTYQPLSTTFSTPSFSSTLYLARDVATIGPELCGSSSR